jgi:predicted RNase H-like HicB family nuclease
MSKARYVYWQDGGVWLGYLEEFPDYLTQGVTTRDLEEHLNNLLLYVNSGLISAVTRPQSSCEGQ